MAEELQNNKPQQDTQELLEPQTSSNKRIAKNALMLYIRMFLTMVLGLYTSRVVLATLGVEDYGIYGVVGGVVAMMGFLNASMSGATSRFLTFELGRGDFKKLGYTFSSALIVHIGIAIVVLIIAETVGLWFLCNKLVIPDGRMGAAHWVYQCSILSAMLGIIQAPYNASIIAHEKMDVYAYIEIMNAILKLLIVFLLVVGNIDRLILYSILMFLVSFLVITTYIIYCLKNFNETHFKFIWNKSILKPLLSFSGWDLFGHASVTIRHQGTNFIINIFFGVIYNAASSIAITVNGFFSALTSSVIQAFRPQIIKKYANAQIVDMQKLINMALKFSVFAFGCAFTPIFFKMPFILRIWLGVVPEHAISFCRILMLVNLIGIINSIICIGIHSTGKIKSLSFISGSLYLINLPIIYLSFLLFKDSNLAYYLMGLFNVIILIIDLLIIKNLISELNVISIIKTILKIFIVLIVSAIIAIPIYLYIKSDLLSTILITIINFLCVSIITFLFVLNKQEKKRVISFIHKTKNNQ